VFAILSLQDEGWIHLKAKVGWFRVAWQELLTGTFSPSRRQIRSTSLSLRTKTSAYRNLVTISSDLWRFFGILILLFTSKDMPKGRATQWEWIGATALLG
jgi:hypothetical protein